MAHTKAQKATKGNRDSFSKRLGVKIFGDQAAKAGHIIIRQRGNKYFAGENVLQGKDFTLMALKDGQVKFTIRHNKSYVSVV
ncbi:MAG: 50S ribosomal protein L27 [bacterium]